MKEHLCQIVSKEELVAYIDDDLSPAETERITEHVSNCSDCRVYIEILERSLQITQAIWQTEQDKWPETCSFNNVRAKTWSYRKVLAVAASILLILAIGTTFRIISDTEDESKLFNEQEKIAEIRFKIAESSHAAQLLAAAELLSKYPEAENRVTLRYKHIVETYPETAAAAEARLKLQ